MEKKQTNSKKATKNVAKNNTNSKNSNPKKSNKIEKSSKNENTKIILPDSTIMENYKKESNSKNNDSKKRNKKENNTKEESKKITLPESTIIKKDEKKKTTRSNSKNNTNSKNNHLESNDKKEISTKKETIKIKLPESTIMKNYEDVETAKNIKTIDKKTEAKKEVTTKKIKKRKLKKKNAILLLCMILAFAFLIYSGFYIIRWFIDNGNTHKMTEQIQEKVVIEEIEDKEETEIVEPEVKPPESDPYWDYIKMNLIDVDFTELKTINSETKGWIQVNGTNINYPFVQHSDNSYYLTHQFDKAYNGGGWVFLDYRNNISDLGKNTIIYAHGRENKTMFGTLKNILNSDWYNDTNNHIIKLSTETQNTLWQVFSVYRIPNTNDYIKTTFLNDDTFKTFADMLKNRSAVNFNTTLSKNDKILTLSTCWNDYEKVVMHAKLIKYVNR